MGEGVPVQAGRASLRPKPVMGSSAVSVGWMTPRVSRVSSPASAAAEVGSAKMPSEDARRFCQAIIESGGAAGVGDGS